MAFTRKVLAVQTYTSTHQSIVLHKPLVKGSHDLNRMLLGERYQIGATEQRKEIPLRPITDIVDNLPLSVF